MNLHMHVSVRFPGFISTVANNAMWLFYGSTINSMCMAFLGFVCIIIYVWNFMPRCWSSGIHVWPINCFSHWCQVCSFAKTQKTARSVILVCNVNGLYLPLFVLSLPAFRIRSCMECLMHRWSNFWSICAGVWNRLFGDACWCCSAWWTGFDHWWFGSYWGYPQSSSKTFG